MSKKIHHGLVSVRDLVRSNHELRICDEPSLAFTKTIDSEGTPISTKVIGNPHHVITNTDYIEVDLSRFHYTKGTIQ